ncbi:hypothetical protein WR25_22695 [Diploscapter pachys]|uniref:Uncharacterized protein n=1 Tax=Diploscapter pachys TaxID=2018661 RepID=A0A2A2M0S0_9BILA|nr:hypothetical protein WR25_22695 [Diploscapter pachys]
MESDASSDEEPQPPECNQTANQIKELTVNERIEQIGGNRVRLSSQMSLEEAVSVLQPAFFNADIRIRRAALQIMAQFDVQLEEYVLADGIHKSIASENVYEILLNAEQTELIDFRGRLLQFRKLLYGSHLKHMPKGFTKQMEAVIVQVGFSQFFVQFNPVWKGIHELLYSFARGMPIDDFWSIAASCFEHICQKCDGLSSSEGIDEGLDWLLPNESLHESKAVRVDYGNARTQMLNFFEKIADLAERRTRVLSPLLIRFYKNSFLPLVDNPDLVMKNKGTHKLTESTETESDKLKENQKDEETRAEEEEEDGDDLPKEDSASRMSRWKLTQTLIAFLKIFAKFEDAKSVFMEPQIRQIYEELLMSNNCELQPVALACLLSYKNKAVSPYREYLENLLDEKKFRNTIVLFKIAEDEEDAVVNAEHRQHVIPLLLRLLCGKLSSKTKKKALAGSRRSAILRYLGGLRPEEMHLFLQLYFQTFFDLVGDGEDNFDKMHQLCQNQELLSAFDLDRLNRSLESASEMLRKISRSLGPRQSSTLFSLFLCVSVIVRLRLQNPLTPVYLHAKLKDLRMSIGLRLAEFFSAFPNRPICCSHLRGLTDFFLLPYIHEANSIDSSAFGPLPILPLSGVRLVTSWCKLPAFYDLLLIKLDWNGKQLQPIELLLNTLLWNGATAQICNAAKTSIKCMIELSDEERVPKLDAFEYAQVEQLEDANYGTSILVQHMSKILHFFTHHIESEKSVRADTLNILNRLSEFVHDSEMATRMANALLSSMRKNDKRKEETTETTLRTVGRLVGCTKQSEKFINKLPHLLSSVEGRLCRLALVEVVKSIQHNPNTPQNLRLLLQILVSLEAWDQRKIDEPDHEARHNAYSQLFEIWNSNEKISLTMVAAFAHAHYATLTTSSDLSLRSAAASNLRAMFPYVNRLDFDEQTERMWTIDTHFVPLTLRVLKNSNEVVREEGIRCLSALIDAFSSHPGLSQLKELKNPTEDLDFFHNATHIQKHRHQRAFYRLANDLRDHKLSISFEVLNKFILPIAAPYFVNSDTKLSVVSDEALRVLHETMSSSPWPVYANCLKQWLQKMQGGQDGDNKKPIVRVLVSVIDAFHFDVADVEEEMEAEEARKEDKDEEDDKENGEGDDGDEMEDSDANDNDNADRKRYAIRDRINRAILPKLVKCINGHTGRALVHRKAETSETRFYTDDDDIQRAPVALATVKLLIKLPPRLRTILKLSTLMISHSIQVRETARNVMIKVCQCLGPTYLPMVIREMKQTMKQGYQVHVVIFSTHSIVSSLSSQLSFGQLDVCLQDILQLCMQDQFEDASEEKDIGKIHGEVPEAKAKKTPQMFSILGRFVSQRSIGKVIRTLRDIVDHKTNSKTIQKVSDLLEKFAYGLKANEGENFEFKKLNHKQTQEPKRIGAIVKTAVKSRVHVFVEFELHLLSMLLFGKRLDASREEDRQLIDAFVPLVIKGLQLKYDKIISYSLRCLTAMLPMNLPSLKNSMKEIPERLFVILSDYSTIGNAANRQSVLQLNQLLFKALTQLIISAESSQLLTKKHISLLLSYVEADILDADRQATAFSLIKAIVKKNIKHSKIPEVMQRLSELCIQSSLKHIRAQCRETLAVYMSHESNVDSAKEYIEFFLAQLAYEYEDGRLSAAEMLNACFEKLPQEILSEVCMLCVAKFGAQIVNEDSSTARKFLCGALRQLLESVSSSAKEDVVSAALEWMHSHKEGTRSVGVQVVLQLSVVEKNAFFTRLPLVIEAYEQWFDSEQVLIQNSEPTLVTALTALIHMENNCEESVQKDEQLSRRIVALIDKLESLAKCADSLALRKAASAFIGKCLSLSMVTGQGLQLETGRLLEWAVWMMKQAELDEEAALQASKNIVHLAEGLDNEGLQKCIHSLSKVCKFEIQKLPKDAIRRLSCFKIVAALLMKTADTTRLQLLIDPFMPLLVREINRKSEANADELCTMAGEVAEVIRKKIGEEEYTKKLAETQRNMNTKAAERKRKNKELAVVAPEAAAEAKRKKNKKKFELKKRKIDESKPYRVAKRRRIEKFHAKMDED